MLRLPAILLLSCAALCALSLEAGDGFRWRIEQSSEIARPAVPESAAMGGVTWVSNDVYWTVTDWNPQVWEMVLPVDPQSGSIKECRIRSLSSPQDALDVEGIARDPLDGSVWMSDERNQRITRHDPLSGKRLDTVDLPPIMNGIYEDLGLESLTISKDGLVMWTCTEEALKVDGSRSTNQSGSDVRLTKLIRNGLGDRWLMAGQWVYRTDPIAGGPWYMYGTNSARSGISELCVLDDGTLLVLEREFSKVLIPRLRCRIYEIDLSFATEVSGVDSIKKIDGLKRADKRLLFETSGFSMYEGMCVGPELSDGSRLVVLVSDGNKYTLRTVMTLRLRRL